MDHPVDVVVVADVAAADGVVVVAAASSGHRPASVAAAEAVVAVDRAGASVDSCSATAGRTFPWPSFRSSAVAAGHRPSFAAACGVVAVPATAGPGASVAGCGGAEDVAVAFASWSSNPPSQKWPENANLCTKTLAKLIKICSLKLLSF